MISLTNKQVSGVYNRKLGEATVTTLLDGHLDIPKELFEGVEKEAEINLILDSSTPDTYKILMNGFLINQNGQLTLVDPGGSIYAEPTLGQLMENLKSIGVSPDRIDNILLTHIHPDHSYGLLDENGEKAFKNAQLFVHEKDLAFWMDDRNVSKVHPIFEITFELTKKAYLLYKDQCRTFSKEEEILPGIFTIESPGHTIGHTCFLLQSGNEKMLIWGDMAHIPELEVPKPEIEFLMDLDPELALKSRKRIFDMASSEQLVVAAMHTDFPGFGYVKRNTDSYLFVKEQWHPTL